MERILEVFNVNFIRDFRGSGLLLLLYFVALIYLLFKEKDRLHRVLLLYVPFAVLFVFCLPLTYMAYAKAMEQATYYRFLWLLPTAVTIAYAGVKLFQKKRLIGLLLCAALIVAGGNYFYDDIYEKPSENLYQIPEDVVEICDKIHPAFYEANAAFPAELLSYVLQYDSSVHMPYGREMLAESEFHTDALYSNMCAEILDSEAATQYCRDNNVEYIILKKDRAVSTPMEDLGWVLYGESDNYNIYRHPEIPSNWERIKEYLNSLPEEEREERVRKDGLPENYNDY